MKKLGYIIPLVFVSVIFIVFISPDALSWGFYAHKKINRMAVYGVPAPLSAFYKKNIDYITQHAVDPDKLKFVDSTEAVHHFINVDHYGVDGFKKLPKYWKDAVKKYTEDTLNKYGMLPWQISLWEYKLTEAFKKKDIDAILKASAFLGHYIADAHVPLHTVSNFNGQETNQKGVHALWESAIPEAFGGTYQHINGGAVYLKDPTEKIWSIIEQSYSLATLVLSIEKEVSSHFTNTQKYLPSKNENKKPKYSPAYIAAYNKALNGMVEKQLHSAAIDLASFWYTAWVNAGQPDISKLRTKD
jgi:hypothetical protein